jgi:AcrR family transcriptional regulator
MQVIKGRRSNIDRSATTRGKVLEAAKTLFIAKGYADTGTPEIAAKAGMTRGALYHHFEDKRALYLALVEAESAAVAAEIEDAASATDAPIQMLHTGASAYLLAMQKEGRTRLILIEAPAVLGFETVDAIDAKHGRRTLLEGLEAAMRPSPEISLIAVVNILSAAFDRAAIAIAAGGNFSDYDMALKQLIDGLVAERSTSTSHRSA